MRGEAGLTASGCDISLPRNIMRTKSAQEPARARRATNLNLPAALVAEARAMGVSLSRAAEDGISRAVAEARASQWRAENTAAIQSSNDFVEANGLPLAKHRQF